MSIPYSGLNPAQLEAVHYVKGPCLVLAGAGSGKTRVITQKIARLIEVGLEPKRIAAITFTNKAASEMRDRARKLIGKGAQEVMICTFHALGVRIMRQDGHVLGLKPQFSILDSDDVISILKDCGGTTDVNTARQWQWAISAWKNAGLTSAQAEGLAQNENERVAARIMDRYEERLSAYQSVDFDDLIGLPLKLLAQHPEVRERWQACMGHVLVDEYQDTNATQYEVLKHLVGERARFTAVGDDDQSIYGWRGATLDNLKRLPQDFPQLKVVTLEQNYRSTSAILRAANNVIEPNPKLYPKNFFLNWVKANRFAWWMLTTKNTKPTAWWLAFSLCAQAPPPLPAVCNTVTTKSLLFCTAPITWPSHLKKLCGARKFLTRCRADKAFLTVQKSKICVRGFACGSTTTTTLLSCGP